MNVAGTVEPAGCDRERNALHTVDREVLARIDFDLEPQSDRRHILGIETVNESHTTFPLRPAQPVIENFMDSFHHTAGRLGHGLYKIDVLRITRGRFQVKFVKRGATAE